MAMVGNGEKNRTDIRRRSGNVSCAIFFIKNTNSSPWWLNLQVSCSGDVLIVSSSSSSSSRNRSNNNRIFLK